MRESRKCEGTNIVISTTGSSEIDSAESRAFSTNSLTVV